MKKSTEEYCFSTTENLDGPTSWRLWAVLVSAQEGQFKWSREWSYHYSREGKNCLGVFGLERGSLREDTAEFYEMIEALDKLNAKLLPSVLELAGSQWKQHRISPQAQAYTERTDARAASPRKQPRLAAGSTGEAGGQISFPELQPLSPWPETDGEAGQALTLTQYGTSRVSADLHCTWSA